MPFFTLGEAILEGVCPWCRGGKLEPSMELARLTLEPARHILDLTGGVCATKHFWYWTWRGHQTFDFALNSVSMLWNYELSVGYFMNYVEWKSNKFSIASPCMQPELPQRWSQHQAHTRTRDTQSAGFRHPLWPQKCVCHDPRLGKLSNVLGIPKMGHLHPEIKQEWKERVKNRKTMVHVQKSIILILLLQ